MCDILLVLCVENFNGEVIGRVLQLLPPQFPAAGKVVQEL
jgi:hypothetical protein